MKRSEPNTRRLTERFALHTKAADGPIIWDVECKGFGLRVMPSGVKSFIIDYRTDGRQRRMTIGRLGDWTVEGARTYARELKVRVDKGEDPYGKAIGHTIADARERYERERLPKLSKGTQTHYKRFALVLVEKFGKRRLDTVVYNDLEKLHRSIESPYQANRLVEFARVLWNSAIKWQWATHNPTKGIELNQEYSREDQYLTIEELRKVLLALGESPYEDAADLFVFLLATGCRPGEARSATWGQFDMENGVWTKPAASTKQRRIHRVPLNAMALRVIANRPRREDAPVFCYPDGRPIMRGEKVWRGALRKAGVRRLVVYAARHSFASVGASQGLTLQVVGKLLGHTQMATTQRYAHLFDEILRHGTGAVGDAMKEKSLTAA